MSVNAVEVVQTGAAFLGAYLGARQTRREIREAVAEVLRPRARRVWVALAGLGRRVRVLEQAGAAREA